MKLNWTKNKVEKPLDRCAALGSDELEQSSRNIKVNGIL
jgi:hypothetical protein